MAVEPRSEHFSDSKFTAPWDYIIGQHTAPFIFAYINVKSVLPSFARRSLTVVWPVCTWEFYEYLKREETFSSRGIFHNSLLSLVSTHPALTFQGGSANRGLATMMGNLSLVPETYMMGRKNWPLQVVLWPTHMYFCANTPHLYIYIFPRMKYYSQDVFF